MYADPTHIRAKAIKVRFTEVEHDLIAAHAQFNEMQLATFAREAIFAQIRAWERDSHESQTA